MDAALTTLQQSGWSVRFKARSGFTLNDDFARRYPTLPAEYVSFLRTVEHCNNAAGTVWFLCESHFNATATDTAFRWHEWEDISLEAAKADNDAEWEKTIRLFWDNHLPILLSVKNGYAFAALSLFPKEYGAVVIGFEPEFEEVETVTASLTDFLDQLAEAVCDGEGSNRLRGFL